MQANEYQRLALNTESTMYPMQNVYVNRLLHTSLGLVTEAGEFADVLKKNLFYGKTIDSTNLAEELGDLLWYVAIACDALGTTIEDVMARNITKLIVRYPDKFNTTNAVNRDLDAERKVLEE